MLQHVKNLSVQQINELFIKNILLIMKNKLVSFRKKNLEDKIFQQKDKDKRKQKINYGPIKNTLEKKFVKTDRVKSEV